VSDPQEISPLEYLALRDANTPHRLIDCRTQQERAITHIDDDEGLLPVDDLPMVFDAHFEGREDETTIVYCRSGKRSLAFVQELHRRGVTNSRSLAGGVNRWNTEVAPGNPTY
jgi:adenylyltransferase/sulfurtransferase